LYHILIAVENQSCQHRTTSSIENLFLSRATTVNMSGKLDQSLDEILSSQRKTAGHRRPARRSAGRPAATAPVGGVQKTSKPVRNNAAKPAPAKTARAAGESKVIVSNLVCSPASS
jgi:hypothetical protein